MRVKLFDSSSHTDYKYAPGVIEEAVKKFMEQRPLYVSFKPNTQEIYSNLTDAAAEVENIERYENGNIWGELRLLSTPNGQILANIPLDKVEYSLYGMGRATDGEIIDYTILGISISLKSDEKED